MKGRGAMLAWLLGTVLAGIGLWLVKWDGLDLNVYRYGGLTLRLEPDALYAPTTGRPGDPGLPFTYPPFAALLFVPLSYVSHGVGYGVLSAVALLLAALVALDLAPRLRAALPGRLASLAPWLTWATVLGACLVSGPYRDTLSFGQVNIVLMAACYLAVARLGLGFWTGVVIGLCGGVKLTPLALGVLPGARRRWDCVAGIAAGFLGATGIGWAVLPTVSNQYWFHVLGDPARIGGLAYIDNVSLRGMLARFGIDGGAAWLVVSLLVIGAVWWFLAGCGERTPVELLGLAALPMLAASPITWSHHWVWLPVVALSLLAVREHVPPGGRALLWGSFALVAAYLALSPKVILKACGLDPEGHIPAPLAHLSDLPAAWVLLASGVLAWAAARRRSGRAGRPEPMVADVPVAAERG